MSQLIIMRLVDEACFQVASFHSPEDFREAQPRLQTCLLNLLNDPIPVAGGLHGNRCAGWTIPKIRAYRSWVMFDAALGCSSASDLFSFCQCVLLVTVKSYILSHV